MESQSTPRPSKRSHSDVDATHVDAKPTTTSTTPSKPEPKRVACIHCRQSKLRCDAFERDPCSRCARLHLNCSKDTGYKRVNKKTKVDALEQELHQLKAVLVTNNTATPLTPRETNGTASPSTQAAAASLASFPSSGFAFEDKRPYYSHPEGPYPGASSSQMPLPPLQLLPVQQSNNLPPPRMPGPAFIAVPPATRHRAIESIVLAADQITQLFRRYFDHDHPWLPVLDPCKSPDDYYESSQLLFWCIIVIGGRNWPADRQLSATLYKIVHKLVWEKVADPPLSLHNIQALLLICMWPSTNVHLWSDISMSLSNIAMTAAMHSGLHRPDFAHEFMRKPKGPNIEPLKQGDRAERGRTWATCNIIAQYMTVHFGHPPMVSCFDWATDRACEVGNAYTLPDDLRHHLILQRFAHKATQLISNNRADPLGFPSESEFAVVMEMLEADLGVIEAQMLPLNTKLSYLLLEMTRFYLLSLHWLRPNMTPSKRAGVLRSYSSACTVITNLIQADNNMSLLPCAPIICVRHLMTAGYIIYKILNSSFRVLVDQATGSALMSDAQIALRRMSTAENDLPVRAANILQDVWAHKDDEPGEKIREPGLALRSRLGCSMISDCAWRWRTYYRDAMNKDEQLRVGERVADASGAVPQDDPLTFAFNWDSFEDFDWNWAFDAPLLETPVLPVGR